MRVPQRSLELTQVTEWNDGKIRLLDDYLAAEEPLEIRIVSKPILVTMRTPGHDKELTAGFLWTEGLIDSPRQLGALHQMGGEAGGKSNVVDVELCDTSFDPEIMRRNFFAASSCGICGKASINEVRVRGLRPPDANFTVDSEMLCTLPERLRAEQQVFGRTGGLHAAGLFDAQGEMLVLREDIGRHNALDKVVGWALLEACCRCRSTY